MKKGIMAAGGLGLLLGTVFTGVVMGEELNKMSEPDERNCIVRNGMGYKWEANIDKDSVGSPFYAADIKSGRLVVGPIKKDRNINRTTDIGVTGIYKKDPSCDPK